MKLIKINDKNEKWEKFVDIYMATFKDYEREDIDKISKNVESGKNEVSLIENDKGVVGFSIVSNSSKNNYSLLWYLGVSPEFQGQGLGTDVLHTIINDYKLTSSQPRLMLEAEPRQAKWYAKNGFSKIEHDYHFPTFNDDTMSPTSLMTIEKGKIIKKENFKEILSELYTGVYGAKSNEERIIKELASVTTDIKLKKQRKIKNVMK